MGGGRGGMGGGREGRDGPNGGANGGRGGQSTGTPPNLTVRWESALPVQEALLKTRDTGSPSVDEGHYAITVIGVPNRMTQGKPQAELKIDGKKGIKSSDAKVIPRDEGNIIVFLFSRSHEITRSNKEVEFDAHIGPLEVNRSFQLDEMVYEGKREL